MRLTPEPNEMTSYWGARIDAAAAADAAAGRTLVRPPGAALSAIRAVPAVRLGTGIDAMYVHAPPCDPATPNYVVAHTCPGCQSVAPSCLPTIDPKSLCGRCIQPSGSKNQRAKK